MFQYVSMSPAVENKNGDIGQASWIVPHIVFVSPALRYTRLPPTFGTFRPRSRSVGLYQVNRSIKDFHNLWDVILPIDYIIFFRMVKAC